jgi:hypothetical protein
VGLVRIFHNYSGKTPALPGATAPAVFMPSVIPVTGLHQTIMPQ